MYNILQIQTKISNNIKNKAKQSNIYTYTVCHIYIYIYFLFSSRLQEAFYRLQP